MTISKDISLRLEPLALHHVPQLLAIEQEAYPDPWTQGMFQQEITNRISHFFVAYIHESLAAYAGFWLVADEIHITKFTVAEPFRGRGYGRLLMEHLIEMGLQLGGTTVRLEVRESNTPARSLYENMGFQVTGIRKDYYSRSREAAVVMVKEIAGDTGA